MRVHVSFMVKFCLAKAVECRCAAERATDPTRRRSWLNTEGQWFFLARSYDNERRASVVTHVGFCAGRECVSHERDIYRY